MNQGKSISQVAKGAGVGVDTARKWAKAAGFSLPRGKGKQRFFTKQEEAQVDAARKVRDEFFCAPAREEPNKESLRASA